MDYKKEILEALQAKFTGGNAGVLNWIATQLAKTVTAPEQVQTAVDGISQEYVSMMESYGDSRATSSAKTAVSNYEANHGLKDGKPVKTPPAQQQQGGENKQQPATGGAAADEIPAWAQALIARLDANDKQRTTESRKAKFSSVIAKLPENLRKPYERIAVDSLKDDEFDTLVNEVTTEVNGLLGDLQQKGVVFTPPAANNGSQGAKATDAEVDAVLDKLNI